MFLDDRKKYFRKFILQENVEDDESDYLTFGALVDTLLLEPHMKEERFLVSKIARPTGMIGDFVDALHRRTLESMNEDGEVTRSLTSLLEEAYNDVKFDRHGNIVAFKRDSLDVVIGKFIDKEPELYYRELRAAYGKTVISIDDEQNAERAVRALKSSEAIGPIVNQETNERYTVCNQLIIRFAYKGYKLKCMLDKVIIDHQEKLVTPYDLKTCWNVDGFELNYRKYRYYIQLAVYTLGVAEWMKQEGWNYSLAPFKFIAQDSSNYMEPLLYDTDMENLYNGINGFTLSGKEYPGLNKAIEDLTFHRETGIWTISADNQRNKGLVKLKAY